MKPIVKKTALILCLFIFISHSLFSQNKQQAKVKTHHLISINHQGSDTNVSQGFWSLDKDLYGTLIHLSSSKSMHYSFKNDSFFISFYPSEEELSKISNTTENFSLDRPAGTIHFDAETHRFNFVINKTFETFLKTQSITSTKAYDFMKLFLGEVDKDYVLGVKAMGYQPTMRQLGKLGIQAVSLNYISEVNKYYKNLDMDMLVRFFIHGVSPEYLEGLKALGYGTMDANMVKKFAVHRIRLTYIQDLKALGYGDLDPNMIKKFAIHKVKTSYIEGLNTLGYTNLDPNTIKKLVIHKVSLKYIKSLQGLSLNKPSLSQLKKAKIHKVTANFIKRAHEAGHSSRDLSDYVKLKIRGI